MNPRLNLPLPGFQFAQMPEIHFAPGAVLQLPRIAARYGKRVLLVTGSGSFSRSDRHAQLMNVFTHAGIETFSATVTGEPSPAFVDATVAAHRDAMLAGAGDPAPRLPPARRLKKPRPWPPLPPSRATRPCAAPPALTPCSAAAPNALPSAVATLAMRWWSRP